METKEKLEDLFGASPYKTLVKETKDFAVFHLNREGIILSWNKGAEYLFGYTEAEIIGRHGEIIFTPEDRARNVPQMEMQQAEAEGRTDDVRWHLKKDGTRFYANGITTAIRDEAGILRGFAKIARDDTPRKQIEDAFEQSNQRIGNILESITDALFVLDFNWRFTYLNKQSESLLGRSREELLGNNIWEEFPEAVGLTFYEHYHRALAEQTVVMFEEFYPPLNTWFEVRAYPSAEGLSVYFHDINERKQSEILLRESEQKFATMAEVVPQLVWMAEADGSIFWYNRNWYEYTGTTPEDMKGWGWQSVHDLELLPSVIEKWQKCIETGEPFEMEFPLRGADGVFRWFLTRVNPSHSREGRIIRWFGTNTDIDEQRQMSERNRFIMELDEAVRALESQEEITLTLARLLGEYLDADRCAYAEVETDEDHFVIQGDYTKNDVQSIVGHYRMSDFGAELLRSMRANQPYVVADGDTDARISENDLVSYRLTTIRAAICVPLHKNGRFSACMAVHQKTPRRWLPEEIELVVFVANRFGEFIERARLVKSLHESLMREQEARQSAEQANKIKDEFLATVSHELRTPLNAILGWSNILRGGKADDETAARALETIERNARSQAQLIDDLLDISRIITGKLRLEIQTIELSILIESAVEAVRPAANAKNIRLQTLLDSEAGLISGDPNRLQQVIWNLLTNAVKFTPKGGRVQVRLERINSHVELTVGDTGKGIASEFLPYVFDRFRQADQTTTRRQGGLGLGLSIVRQLVEMHGGTVHAESEGEEKGTNFIVNLPRQITVRKSENEKENRLHPTAGGYVQFDDNPQLIGLRILVVDDESDSQALLRTVLEHCGAEVVSVNSSAEALKTLEINTFDVLVSDIGMPDEDGYSLISKIRLLPREKGGRIPAIALTAYARVEDRVRALNAGFQAHVPKPVESVELVAIVANLINGFGKN